jgi:hypothetical protein
MRAAYLHISEILPKRALAVYCHLHLTLGAHNGAGIQSRAGYVLDSIIQVKRAAWYV